MTSNECKSLKKTFSIKLMTVSSCFYLLLETLGCCWMYSEKPFNVCKSKRFQIIMFDMQILIALVCNN